MTSVRLNFVYLHFWLLNYHISRAKFKDPDFVKAQLKESPVHNQARAKIDASNVSQLQDRLVAREHVLTYTNSFDDAIHEELKRQRRVIDHSLSALFEHSPRSLENEDRLVTRLDDDDLEEAILYNILNEEPDARREQIKRISDYIRICVHEEDSFTFSQRMESYFYQANKDDMLKDYDQLLIKESYR